MIEAGLIAPDGNRPPVPEILTVVGSKGKGTTATYASAYLAAAGFRVVTVTSPSFRRVAERIRVDGAALEPEAFAGLTARLDDHRARLPAPDGSGYLSPSGLFTIAGLLWAREVEADYVVLEAGRGGASDEVSLVAPAVVAVAPIFAEHLAELGGTLPAVIADKCAVVRETTRAVLVGRQPDPDTRRHIGQHVATRTLGRVAAVDAGPADTALAALPDPPLPAGLGGDNAQLGCAAAHQLGRAAPDPAALEEVLTSVRLPGRLSRHRLPGSGSILLIDSAVSRAGFEAAIGYAQTALGGIDHLLLSLPDDKDLTGAVAALLRLPDLPVSFVRLDAPHLRFTWPVPPGWRRVDQAAVTRTFLSRLGARVLALGTVSFVAHLLEVLDVPTGTAYVPIPPGR